MNKRSGTSKEAADKLERRQLAVIRSMSLNQTASDPRTLNGTVKVEDKARAALSVRFFPLRPLL